MGEKTDQWWKSLDFGIDSYAEGEEEAGAKNQNVVEDDKGSSSERIKQYEDKLTLLLQQKKTAKAAPRDERDEVLIIELKRNIAEVKRKLAYAVNSPHPKEREEMEAEFRKRRGKLIKAFDEAEEAENYDALEQIQMKLINFTFARYS